MGRSAAATAMKDNIIKLDISGGKANSLSTVIRMNSPMVHLVDLAEWSQLVPHAPAEENGPATKLDRQMKPLRKDPSVGVALQREHDLQQIVDKPSEANAEEIIISSRVSDTGGKRANAQLVTWISRRWKGHAVSLTVHTHLKACLPLLGPPPLLLHSHANPPLLLLLAPMGATAAAQNTQH
ncbi:unnamed protein product [Pleuronectes platessa]|uniref:Uncharacterized protein n=1 Tax=Pleuronectes platessa TaxID=8262 RepID=A0A9N7UXD4_PLEPL|nr:unnamed protein product [Pleuronectes platessa]